MFRVCKAAENKIHATFLSTYLIWTGNIASALASQVVALAPMTNKLDAFPICRRLRQRESLVDISLRSFYFFSIIILLTNLIF